VGGGWEGGAGHAGFSTGGGHTSGATASFSGADWHPASASAQAVPIADNARMGWVLFEIAVALAIAIAIVWWTIPKKPKSDAEERER